VEGEGRDRELNTWGERRAAHVHAGAEGPVEREAALALRSPFVHPGERYYLLLTELVHLRYCDKLVTKLSE